VAATPNCPLSSVWFDAVSQASHPVHAIARASSAGAFRRGKGEGAPAPIGISTWQSASAARRTIGRIRAKNGRKS
jgi:hypothetical protein